MINHWIGGSPLCEEKNDHEKWHTRHSQSCRSACSSTSSRTIGSLRGKLRQQKKATRHRCVWMDLHFLYPQVWSFEYEKWSWTSGRNGYTYLSCESSSAGKDTSSISKILSCKEATKDHQSTAKSKIQRSDRASLADKALQSLQGLRRRHPSEHSSCGGETWNHVETIHFSSGPSFFDQSWSKSLFFGMGVWVKMIDPAFCDGLRSQKWPRAISQSRQPHFPWPWLRCSHCHGLLLLLHILGLQFQCQGSYLRCIHGQAPNLDEGFFVGKSGVWQLPCLLLELEDNCKTRIATTMAREHEVASNSHVAFIQSVEFLAPPVLIANVWTIILNRNTSAYGIVLLITWQQKEWCKENEYKLWRKSKQRKNIKRNTKDMFKLKTISKCINLGTATSVKLVGERQSQAGRFTSLAKQYLWKVSASLGWSRNAMHSKNVQNVLVRIYPIYEYSWQFLPENLRRLLEWKPCRYFNSHPRVLRVPPARAGRPTSCETSPGRPGDTSLIWICLEMHHVALKPTGQNVQIFPIT